jgi:hypothetical protein
LNRKTEDDDMSTNWHMLTGWLAKDPEITPWGGKRKAALQVRTFRYDGNGEHADLHTVQVFNQASVDVLAKYAKEGTKVKVMGPVIRDDQGRSFTLVSPYEGSCGLSREGSLAQREQPDAPQADAPGKDEPPAAAATPAQVPASQASAPAARPAASPMPAKPATQPATTPATPKPQAPATIRPQGAGGLGKLGAGRPQQGADDEPVPDGQSADRPGSGARGGRSGRSNQEDLDNIPF